MEDFVNEEFWTRCYLDMPLHNVSKALINNKTKPKIDKTYMECHRKLSELWSHEIFLFIQNTIFPKCIIEKHSRLRQTLVKMYLEDNNDVSQTTYPLIQALCKAEQQQQKTKDEIFTMFEETFFTSKMSKKSTDYFSKLSTKVEDVIRTTNETNNELLLHNKVDVYNAITDCAKIIASEVPPRVLILHSGTTWSKYNLLKHDIEEQMEKLWQEIYSHTDIFDNESFMWGEYKCYDCEDLHWAYKKKQTLAERMAKTR